MLQALRFNLLSNYTDFLCKGGLEGLTNAYKEELE